MTDNKSGFCGVSDEPRMQPGPLLHTSVCLRVDWGPSVCTHWNSLHTRVMWDTVHRIRQ